MSKRISIEITQDIADEIVCQSLKESIALLKLCIAELHHIPKNALKNYQQEDLVESKNSLKALEKTLEYYSSYSE